MSADVRADALELVRRAAAAAQEAGDLDVFLGDLERIRVQAVLGAARVQTSALDFQGRSEAKASARDQEDDRLLSAAEFAQLAGVSVWYVREHKNGLPIVRLTGGRYKFSAKGAQRWIRQRAGG